MTIVGKGRWTTTRMLAAAALVLGAVATVGQPVRGHSVTIDTQELAAIVSSKVDHVLPSELADWIIAGATNYRLIDLRDEKDFLAYHIPSAENVPTSRVLDAGLLRNERIILYSDGGIHAAQVWMLLRAQGYKGVTTLFGGLDGWKEDVVFPVTPVTPTADQAAAFARAVQVAAHFGGKPRPAGSGGAESLTLTIAAPAGAAASPAPTGKGGTAPAKKKKEGC